jgi:hypothetical protein
VIGSIAPKQIIGSNRVTIHILHRQSGGVDEDIVERDEVVATGQPVVVTGKCVVVDMDPFWDAGCPEILIGFSIVHQPNPSIGAVDDQVPLDVKDPIGKISIIDQLDPIFAVAGDGIVPDDDI